MSNLASYLMLSLSLLVVAGSLAKSRLGLKRAAAFSGCCIVVACISPLLALQAIITALAAVVCLGMHWPPRVFRCAAVLSAAVCFGIGIDGSVGELQKILEMKQKYPLQSLAERLNFETSIQRERPADELKVALPLPLSLENELTQFERRADRGMRIHQLERLHATRYEQFVSASGFGPVRMIGLQRGIIDLHYQPAPRLPRCEPPANDDDAKDPSDDGEPGYPPAPGKFDLLTTHDAGLKDFLRLDRMGYVRDKEHVAGFVSHRFDHVPTVTPGLYQPVTWQIIELQLISLLRHETPVAYVSAFLPEMDKIKDLPTRTLTPFEHDALEQLRSKEDVVIDDDGQSPRIRMVGAIRAAKDCLACHSARRGELLGAFTYTLAPIKQVAKGSQSDRGQATDEGH